jgi:hypothetical protein
MVGVKTIAALVSIVNGVWVIVAGTYWYSLFGAQCHLSACGGNLALIGLGAILLLDSVVCLIGLSRAFYVSAGISVIVVFVDATFSIQFSSAGFIVTCALALVTIALDLVAASRKKVIAEADHPLNLPVFG